MSDQQLTRQFQKIYNALQGKESKTTLHQLSEILFCTKRHCRNILTRMNELAWIDWVPVSGRGKQSTLRFRRSFRSLQLEQAKALITDGRFESAMDLLEHSVDELALLLREQTGVQVENGKQVLRLPYYRPLSRLDPRKPMRRSEQHLARQIYNGLTCLNEEKGEVEPDLAHFWEALSPRHWRFYLRPSVRFHHGKILDSDDVIHSLQPLKKTRMFAHIERIESPAERIIDIYLKAEDHYFPKLLAQPRAFIMPADQALGLGDFAMPCGTGPYRVSINDGQQLKLEAFELYFGYRALLDVIDIWITPELPFCYLHLGPQHCNAPFPKLGQMRMDDGCQYLLLNTKDGLAADPLWCQYLRRRLSATAILGAFTAEAIEKFRILPAYGLLPGWNHLAGGEQELIPEDLRQLQIAWQREHPLFDEMARVIIQLLEADGFSVKGVPLDSQDIALGEHPETIDIWISGMSLGSRGQMRYCLGFMDSASLRGPCLPSSFLSLSIRSLCGGKLPMPCFPVVSLGVHWYSLDP
ncbi:SgrR family transcriptional regulator [Dongshaea marina]|uniref:SgrR family transcriptional regulator n=1 Tax=Dongshaea marina TaxID=2047966 RepID=UPI000D3E92CD|nr:SgrR family transcriptional regulator [Dongshaea marina]